MTVELNIFNVMQQQMEDDECHYVNLIDAVVQQEFNRNCFSNPLELFSLILLILMILHIMLI